MKIAVINGSPKPRGTSITMKHIDFLKHTFHDLEFLEIDAATRIKKIVHNAEYFTENINKIRQADIIIWAFPVYFYTVPGQLKRFIELVNERNVRDNFNGKYATAIVTSGGVFDYPATEYIQAISEDFGMQFFPGCSFKSLYFKDLLKKEVRESFVSFFEHLLEVTGKKMSMIRKYPETVNRHTEFVPPGTTAGNPGKNGKRLLVLTDHQPQSNLEKMVSYALANTKFTVDSVNFNSINLKSGCLGCVQCLFNGECVIDDDINPLFGKRILDYDAVIFALTMKDRHLSSLSKMVFDRTLFISKKPVYRNIHSAFIVSGPVMSGGFIHEFIQIYTSCRCLNHTGCVSDEFGTSVDIAGNILSLMAQLETNTEKHIRRPYPFFQRAYYLAMREMVYSYGFNSHIARYYRKNKLFDFPNKSLGLRLSQGFLGFLFSFPLTKKKLRNKMGAISSKQYEKVIPLTD